MNIKEAIFKLADDLGFVATGVCDAIILDDVDFLKDAIKNKRIASMEWLARNPDARCDPRSLLAGAKSVICFALPYTSEGIGPSTGSGRTETKISGTNLPFVVSRSNHERTAVARFARGLDYHEEVRRRLEKIADLICEFDSSAKCKICVDTSPILEKALAQKAGLGWIGKNTILINEKIGSWFALGEIITTIELVPDTPHPDKCGRCNKCIDSCPTGALTGPRMLNSKRCVSYLSVGHKDEITQDVQPFIKDGQHGCDICQEVCPHNPR